VSWLIEPGHTAGPIGIGALRNEIREMLGPPRRSADNERPDDHYTSFNVEFDDDDRVVSVEVWPELDPELDGQHLLSLPYIDVANLLRARDPRTVVRDDGTWADGVGVAAQGGVHDPFAPGDSALVSQPGYKSEVPDPPPSRIILRNLSFTDLERALEQAGWTVDIMDRTAPVVAGEPDLAVAQRGEDRLTTTFEPVAGLRTLDLTECSPEAAAEIDQVTPGFASVDAAAALVRPTDTNDVYRGLVLAGQLGDRKLAEHVERYVDNPRKIIADAAARAMAALA
jgi:hypothetical protein